MILRTYIHTYIHIYIVGKDHILTSHFIDVVYVNFIYKSLDLQFKFDCERQIIKKLFMAILIYHQSFC